MRVMNIAIHDELSGVPSWFGSRVYGKTSCFEPNLLPILKYPSLYQKFEFQAEW